MTEIVRASLIATLALATASLGCRAQSAPSAQSEMDMARSAVRRGFASPSSALFRGEKLVDVAGTQGSRAKVVCGEVNRSGRDQTITGGWRPFYYVVAYEPVATYQDPVIFDGNAEKRVSPPLYAAGDYAVLFGDDDDTITANPMASEFTKHWMKFCIGRTAPLDEWTLQERGRPTP